jgi:hypothetical protein
MIWDHLGIVAVIVLVAAVLFAADRARTIAVVEFVAGRPRTVRGRLSARAFAEISDVAARNRLRQGRIVIRREGGRPRVDLSAIDGNAAQQLRNVIGRFRLAELRD